jgi:antitoxin (DNA-binding transcriptional repressor) of toxin-antitoxin stability system
MLRRFLRSSAPALASRSLKDRLTGMIDYKVKYSLRQVETNLSEFIEKARSGEEVIIVRGKQPVAKSVAIQAPELKDRVPGGLKGKILCAPNAFDPLTDQELSDLGFE